MKIHCKTFISIKLNRFLALNIFNKANFKNLIYHFANLRFKKILICQIILVNMYLLIKIDVLCRG